MTDEQKDARAALERLRLAADTARENGTTWVSAHDLTAALDENERLREALSELADCVDDGCYCSEMKMATAVDEARSALKGAGT